MPLISEPSDSSSHLPLAIGIDIGGTKISGALCPSGEPSILHFEEHPTPKQGAAFVDTLTLLIQGLQKKASAAPIGVGIATAGIVNPYTGEILGATGNLPALREIPSLKQALEKATGLTVYLENDANAAAYGEYCSGAAKGLENVLMVTLGTGVGTGIVLNGKLLHGSHFSAAEGGHIAISLHQERLCTCGKWDCWEAYASGTGLRETAHQLLKLAPNHDQTALMSTHQAIEDVTTRDVIAAWRQGDPLAAKILDDWHLHIATGLGSLLNVLDPDITVIGGGLAQFVQFEQLTQLTQARSMQPEVRLVEAHLGNQAGLIGAAGLTMKHYANAALV